MTREHTTGVRVLIAFLVAKLLWDIVTIAITFPDFSRAKMGVAISLPVIIIGLCKGKNWAMNLAGVACMFWIVFVVARLIGPMFTVGEIDVDFPWSNLLAFPAVVFVLNNLKTDEEARAEASTGTDT